MQRFLQAISAPFARFAIFLVYFWFGLLKVVGESPASQMVEQLERQTMPFIPFDSFIIGFGIFEMVIGISFLFKKMDRISIPVFFLHIITTAMPLALLPVMIWTNYFVPTLEGQYIIKNIVLIALVVTIAAGKKREL